MYYLTYRYQLIISAAWITDLRKILKSSLGLVGETSVIDEQSLLRIQDRTVAASGYVAANPVFMILNLPCEISVTALRGGAASRVH